MDAEKGNDEIHPIKCDKCRWGVLRHYAITEGKCSRCGAWLAGKDKSLTC